MKELARGRMYLTDEVYNKMLTIIAEGRWKEGEKIPSEKNLCEMFRVSRISVRSVLQRLQAQGLIYTMQGVGSFVSMPETKSGEMEKEAHLDVQPAHSFTKEDTLIFFEFRQAIEFKAIDLFAARAEDSHYAKLREIIDIVQNCGDAPEEILKNDVEFHMTIIEASQNRYLIWAMTECKSDFVRYVERINKAAGENSQTWVNAHGGIYQKLVDKQPDEAKRILLEHNAIRKLLLS